MYLELAWTISANNSADPDIGRIRIICQTRIRIRNFVYGSGLNSSSSSFKNYKNKLARLNKNGSEITCEIYFIFKTVRFTISTFQKKINVKKWCDLNFFKCLLTKLRLGSATIKKAGSRIKSFWIRHTA